MEKKVYEKPEMNVELFDFDDIIRTSVGSNYAEDDDIVGEEKPTWNIF